MGAADHHGIALLYSHGVSVLKRGAPEEAKRARYSAAGVGWTEWKDKGMLVVVVCRRNVSSLIAPTTPLDLRQTYLNHRGSMGELYDNVSRVVG
jgi:hypothetical protein